MKVDILFKQKKKQAKSSVDPNVCGLNISVLDVNHWTTYTDDLFKVVLTAVTGAKNHRHESRTDEDVYLYLCTCSA